MPAYTEEELEQFHAQLTLVDLHAHPSLKVSLFKRVLTKPVGATRDFDPFGVRTDFSDLRKGGLDLLLSTVYAPEKDITVECPYLGLLRYVMPGTWKRVFDRPYFDVASEMLDAMEAQVKAAPDTARLLRSLPELEAWLNEEDEGRPMGVIHNVEGAHTLDGDAANVERLWKRGVAYLTLAHFYKNEAVHPCFPYPESVQKLRCFRGGRNLALGLTGFGAEVIEEMIRLGMILDIVHCTPPAREQIYDLVGQRLPLIASHVGAFEVNPSPYNLKDRELRKIADNGGLVAVIFMNYWLMPHETKRGLNFVARTLNHFVDKAGIDHVAIGSDFDGFTDPPDDLRDASGFPKLTERLIAEGYTPEQIEKIWGGNVLRVLKEGWGKQE
jgi:microsomal dipeptidase-like Zn-dependent dipeptidase